MQPSPEPSAFAVELKRNTAAAIGAGVCAGVADSFKIDQNLTRIGFVLFAIVLPKLALIGYAAAWVFLDESPLSNSDHK